MTRNWPTSYSENTPPFEKTPITVALTEVFWSESMKLLEMHDFPQFDASVEWVMAHAVKWYYAVRIASNDGQYHTMGKGGFLKAA